MIFDNEHYHTFMYVGISITILLIFFNMMTIVETGVKSIEENSIGLSGKISGYIVEDINDTEESFFSKYITGLVVNEGDNNSTLGGDLQGEVYSETSYAIYFMWLGFLGFGIFVISAIYFLPKLKDYT